MKYKTVTRIIPETIKLEEKEQKVINDFCQFAHELCDIIDNCSSCPFYKYGECQILWAIGQEDEIKENLEKMYEKT